jgi:hypothetical protein
LIVGFKGNIKKDKYNDDYEIWEKLFDDIGLHYLPDEGPWYFGKVIFDDPNEDGAEIQEIDTVEITNQLNNLLEEHISVLSEYIDSDFKVKWLCLDANCLLHPKCFEVLAENPNYTNTYVLENKMINITL